MATIRLKKIKVISEYSTPKTPVQLRRFLSMVNYYLKFMPNSHLHLLVYSDSY